MIPVLTGSTEEVFETMVFQPVVTGAPDPHPGQAPPAGVVGAVSFAGGQTGAVCFYASMTAARAITAAMLGLSPEDVDVEISDAIGELTNMIAGTFRTRMADESGAWNLSTPSVTIGTDLRKLHPGTVERVLCPFRFGDEDVFVELVLTRPAGRPRRGDARQETASWSH